MIDHLGLVAAMLRLAWLWFLGIVSVTMLLLCGGPPPALDAEGGGLAASVWRHAAAVGSRFLRLLTAAWLLLLAQVLEWEDGVTERGGLDGG